MTRLLGAIRCKLGFHDWRLAHKLTYESISYTTVERWFYCAKCEQVRMDRG